MRVRDFMNVDDIEGAHSNIFKGVRIDKIIQFSNYVYFRVLPRLNNTNNTSLIESQVKTVE